MKRILLLLSGFLPFLAAAVDKSKPITLTGTWKEVSRMSLKNSPVPYTDTIRMGFFPGNAYTWRQAGSFIYRGTYTATEKEIDLVMRQFTILSRSGTELVLEDINNRYRLIPYTEAPQAEDNSNAHNGDRANTDAHFDGVKDIKVMAGKWSVYKRTSSEKPGSVDYDRIIRNIYISGATEAGGPAGSVFSAKDAPEHPSWYIDHFSNSTLFCKGRDERQFKVLKCADGELVVQEGPITCFLKQFK